RPELAAIRQKGDLRLGEKPHFPNHAVAATGFACATGTAAKSIPDDANRVGVFERFDRRVESVRHVSVNAREAVQAWTRAHAARNCFVISNGLASAGIDSAKREVVHRAWACRWNAVRQRFS